MLNFQQFNEEFYKTFKNARTGFHLDYFKNPTKKELKNLAGGIDIVRGFIVGKDLIMWNANSDLHAEADRKLKFQKKYIPLNIFMSFEPIDVEIAEFSKNTKWFHNPEAIVQVEQNIHLPKLFPGFLVSTFDGRNWGG